MGQLTLPSWRPGSTREAVEVFLDGAEMLPIEQRVAVFDVDGTLWCERPEPPLMAFLRAELRRTAAARPDLAERAEYRAALEWEGSTIARLGLVNVMVALIEQHVGMTPEAYAALVRQYAAATRHPHRGVPLSQTRYRPMLELIAELRARLFSVYLATGVGTEFVRTLSRDYFGVEPEGVAGAHVGYELARVEGRSSLLRTRELIGDPNEGSAKLVNVQRVLGRRPILAAGNAAGDSELLDYVAAAAGPSLALLVAHDDTGREYDYPGPRPGDGWTLVSMHDDWITVFADA